MQPSSACCCSAEGSRMKHDLFTLLCCAVCFTYNNPWFLLFDGAGMALERFRVIFSSMGDTVVYLALFSCLGLCRLNRHLRHPFYHFLLALHRLPSLSLPWFSFASVCVSSCVSLCFIESFLTFHLIPSVYPLPSFRFLPLLLLFLLFSCSWLVLHSLGV